MGVVLELISMNRDLKFNQLQLWGTARIYTVEIDGSVAFTDEIAFEPTIDEAKLIAHRQAWRLPTIAWVNFFSEAIVDSEVSSRLGESLIAVGFDVHDRHIFKPASKVPEVDNLDDYRYLALWLGRLAEGDERLVPDRYEELLSITENY